MHIYYVGGIIIFTLFVIFTWFGYSEPVIQVPQLDKKPKEKFQFATLSVKQNINDAFHGKRSSNKYLGCFKGKRFESVLSINDPEMTIKKCETLSKERGFRYFGLTQGHVCMGGDKLSRMKKSKTCLINTPGNENHYGGGKDSSSLFRNIGVLPITTRIEKYTRQKNTSYLYKKKDLLKTVKGDIDSLAKICNKMAKCKYIVYNEDNSKIGRLLSDGEKVSNDLQTSYLK